MDEGLVVFHAEDAVVEFELADLGALHIVNFHVCHVFSPYFTLTLSARVTMLPLGPGMAPLMRMAFL